jgi:hypothetical protein
MEIKKKASFFDMLHEKSLIIYQETGDKGKYKLQLLLHKSSKNQASKRDHQKIINSRFICDL